MGLGFTPVKSLLLMQWALLPEIVRLIRTKKADYVLALKNNHPTLHSQVRTERREIKIN